MFYRRAEGLRYSLRPCDRQRILVEVPHRGREALLSRDEAFVLGRMGDWHTPEELERPATDLESLVARDLAFFSPSEKRPHHRLHWAPLARREGPVALRPNLRLNPLMVTPKGIDKLGFMPRVGTLDVAELAGILFRVLEFDEEVAALRVSCCRRHAAALRALVPRLDGRHDWSELTTDENAAEVLDLLDLGGLVESWAPPAWPESAAQVTWLGHAAVLYEAAGQRLIVDPFFHAPSLPERRPRPGEETPFDPRLLGRVDGILITHGDNDHLHAESLLRFATDTPIYLPRATQRMAYQVDLAGVARLCGFSDVRFLDEWERSRVGEVELVATPFIGEDWGLELPKRTYLITHPSLTIYCSADSAFMPEIYRRLAASEPRIDLAFLGIGDCSEPFASGRNFGYGNFYLEWIPPDKLNQWVALTAGPEESAEAARMLGARHAFGYAAGTSYMSMSFSDRGSHTELVARLEGAPVRALNLILGVPTRPDRS